MSWRAIVFCLLACGCQGQGEETASEGAAASGAAPAAVLPAAAFHKDYTSLGAAEAREKYGARTVEIRGKVKRVVGDQNGALVLWLDVDGAAYLSLRLRDGGANAQSRQVHESTEIAASCTIAGRMGNNIMLTDCVLQ